jgi:hypothetical protein
MTAAVNSRNPTETMTVVENGPRIGPKAVPIRPQGDEPAA